MGVRVDWRNAQTSRPPCPLAAVGHWLAGACLTTFLACGGGDGTPVGTETATETATATAVQDTTGQAAGRSSAFIDATAATGLDFRQFNGMSGAYLMAEVTGSGVALQDFDNDGDLDAYFVQGTMIGGAQLESATFKAAYSSLTDRVYRNDLTADGPSFVDVTESSGLTAERYGMGVAAGDFDDDGQIDLYVTNVGSNQLLRNDTARTGTITFVDVTDSAGVDDARWSVPAAFFDFDRDGRLDLYVGNYIAENPDERTICRDFIGALDYCGPGSARAEPDRLFRNLGSGRFEDVSRSAGLLTGFGPALGVVAADLDGNGFLDLYVANDSTPNNLWLNAGDGTFSDDALFAGCSVNANGKAEASMGVDAGDYDRDGDLDLFMTHLTGETNTLFENNGSGVFDDATIRSGLGAPSRLFTSFGTAFLDYDRDGWLDLFTVSGAVKKIEALAREGDPFPVHQTNQLFRNLGGEGKSRFEESTAVGGAVFDVSAVSRGAAVGDLDNDGDEDIVIVNSNGPARVLLNRSSPAHDWVGLRLSGGPGPRDMLGARVELRLAGSASQWRRVRSAGSFASASDPRVLFNLGEQATIREVRVQWPDGTSESWSDVTPNTYSTLAQGSGERD